MRRRRTVSLFVITALAFGALIYTFAVGNRPQLGLDLQGGASVVLTPHSKASSSAMSTAEDIIRSRVDALGVAEPQITRQGNSAIVVELPGVKNQEDALKVVGQTAQLHFRPVLQDLPLEGQTPPTTTTTAPPTTTTEAPKFGETTTTSTSTTTTSTTAPQVKTTTRDENNADPPPEQVVLLDKDKKQRYLLGPVAASGRDVSSATAEIDNLGKWSVALTMTGEGTTKFNALAAQCFAGQPSCPANGGLRGRVAIDLDGLVQSAPQVQTANFEGGKVQISGNFSSKEARQLALVLKYGSLPVQLDQGQVNTVSATLGRDSLHAGLVAGLIGTALVLLYMLLYYRVLGLVVIAGMSIWTALNWSIISWLGVHNGLALSLSGVTGLVVSVGVTVDSYVVYFERLKDELHAGRTMRSAIDSAFKHSFRTVLVADTSAFLAAAVLYLLTVGPVRGFAFFLGLSTILDVVVAYFFKRPLVVVLGRWGLLQKSRFVGLHHQIVPESVRPGLGSTSS